MLEEMLMCVKADDVEFEDGFTEFATSMYDASGHLFYLLNSSVTIHRSKVEDDDGYKQIIVYIIVKDGDKIYSYQRSGGDGRLTGKHSIGIGGHVNISDLKWSDFFPYRSIEIAALREFNEEIMIRADDIDKIGEPLWIGVINDDSTTVNKVHLGVVFEIQLNGAEIWLAECGMTGGQLLEIDDLMQYLKEYESWSQLLILEYLARV